jgi:hypothetical protein
LNDSVGEDGLSFCDEWTEENFSPCGGGTEVGLSVCGEGTDDLFSCRTGEGVARGGARLSTRTGSLASWLEALSSSRLDGEGPITAGTTDVPTLSALLDFVSLLSGLSGVVRFLAFPIGAVAPSSTSSAIPPNLDFRSEDDESEVSDAAEVCSMQADAKVDSFSSDAALNEKTVSCGAKVSRMY